MGQNMSQSGQFSNTELSSAAGVLGFIGALVVVTPRGPRVVHGQCWGSPIRLIEVGVSSQTMTGREQVVDASCVRPRVGKDWPMILPSHAQGLLGVYALVGREDVGTPTLFVVRRIEWVGDEPAAVVETIEWPQNTAVYGSQGVESTSTLWSARSLGGLLGLSDFRASIAESVIALWMKVVINRHNGSVASLCRPGEIVVETSFIPLCDFVLALGFHNSLLTGYDRHGQQAAPWASADTLKKGEVTESNLQVVLMTFLFVMTCPELAASREGARLIDSRFKGVVRTLASMLFDGSQRNELAQRVVALARAVKMSEETSFLQSHRSLSREFVQQVHAGASPDGAESVCPNVMGMVSAMIGPLLLKGQRVGESAIASMVRDLSAIQAPLVQVPPRPDPQPEAEEAPAGAVPPARSHEWTFRQASPRFGLQEVVNCQGWQALKRHFGVGYVPDHVAGPESNAAMSRMQVPGWLMSRRLKEALVLDVSFEFPAHAVNDSVRLFKWSPQRHAAAGLMEAASNDEDVDMESRNWSSTPIQSRVAGPAEIVVHPSPVGEPVGPVVLTQVPVETVEIEA